MSSDAQISCGANGVADTTRPAHARNEAFFSIAATAAACAALALAATTGHDALPVIISDNRYVVPASYVVSGATWLLTAAALPVLWRRSRTVLNLWLMVVVCAWLYDIALAAIFNGGRFTVGWYAGRVYGLLAASLVLFVLLLENGILYGKLAVAHRRHLRQLKLLYEIDMGVTSYQSHAAVAAAVVQPLAGWIGRRFGEVRTFVWSIILFMVFSALCGLATTMPMLLP